MDKDRYLLTVILTIFGVRTYDFLMHQTTAGWIVVFFIIVAAQIISKIEKYRHEQEQIRFIETISSILFKDTASRDKYNELVKKYFNTTIDLEKEDENRI